MDSATITTLYAQVKSYLDITWTDDETTNTVQTLVDDAIETMNHKLGSKTIDYTAAGQYRRLFFTYCLYAYNKSQDQFDDAYRKEINQARDRIKVEASA
jgi:hypothetical protein